MNNLLTRLMIDEAGFIVSAELVMIATLGVLAMAVGLSEVAFNINNELKDIGNAFGSMNQSFNMQGQSSRRGASGGSSFQDNVDFCDGGSSIQAGSHLNGEQ